MRYSIALITKATLVFIFFLSSSPFAKTNRFAIGVGEKLYFRAHWGMFTGGYAMLEIVKKEKIGKQDTFRFRLRAKSSPYMDAFYKVRYDWFANWNFKTRQPIRVGKELMHGFDQREYQMNFDWATKIARYHLKKYKANTNRFGIKRKDAKWREYRGAYARLPLETQDLLSAFYYMRTDARKGRVGAKFTMPLYDDGVMKRVRFEVVAREKIKTGLGQFMALKITTDFRTKGLLRSKGKIRAWISDDKYRLPLKIKIRIPVLDDVEVDLVKVEKAS